MAESPYLRTPEAAEYLGMSRAFLEKARVYGGGPKFASLGRPGGRGTVVYRRVDLDQWVDDRLRATTKG